MSKTKADMEVDSNTAIRTAMTSRMEYIFNMIKEYKTTPIQYETVRNLLEESKKWNPKIEETYVVLVRYAKDDPDLITYSNQTTKLYEQANRTIQLLQLIEKVVKPPITDTSSSSSNSQNSQIV